MDDQFHPHPECTHSSTCDPECTPHDTGMFSHARNFTVISRNLTNITNNNYSPSTPADFRMIPLGDIDLLHEIQLDHHTGIVNHARQRPRIRRLYSARTEGGKAGITVAIYQGGGAEENADFGAAHSYIYSEFRRTLSSMQCTSWIRRSTGRLCTDPTECIDFVWLNYLQQLPRLRELWALDAIHMVPSSMVIESFTIMDCHAICDWNLRQERQIPISAHTTVDGGGVISYSSGTLDNSNRIASLWNVIFLCPWGVLDASYDITPLFDGNYLNPKVLENDWTRLQTDKTWNKTFALSLWTDTDAWLSQANHVFSPSPHCVQFGGLW
ncbi:hypothetical protein MSAN_00134100 [Mycena sanguinolenta]|uniref:Uncharacterized protein n=1 Tax=Mycena sanguinolenta TaxID=230812 RepID=A0A8H6ZKH2_9AGAR|nr:hypothetical protein MSAN_00134100 [Mycena sanguinolenta]